ncbi:TonB-dependent receptor [Piscinibacter sp.]|uniref:TonB-dependent receptor n=1 Tax=Piscinibacter sp. TaxID=1903157 RepID=UPI002F3E2F09
MRLALVRMHPLAAAAALALAGGGCLPAAAQQTQDKPAATEPAKDDKAEAGVERVEITGIRASRQQSLAIKRQADSVVEVISAEDIGKLPDKNVADAIQRVPGVNISSSSGGEGGFAENDRVSIRGLSPSLTQTLVNGHAVASGDWFVLAQTEAVGRSVSYSLLPSEIVGRVVVNKSMTADLPEGGVSGAVDIQTRTPLSFTKPLTIELAAQAVYADLAKKTDPQFNALVNWKNDTSTAGVLFQVFSETRHERRDGQEFLGYSFVDPEGDVAAAHPDLAGVIYPSLIGSAFFEQKRVRQGGLFDFEIKPAKDLTLDVNGFFSHMAADNYDNNFMAAPQSLIDGGISPTSYTVRNNTLVAAIFPTVAYNPEDPFTAPGVVDRIYRPGAAAETWYLDAGAKWTVNDSLKFSGKLGYTHGIGETPGDLGYESALAGHGMAYQMYGLSKPGDVSFPGGDPTNFLAAYPLGAWSSTVQVVDQESYAQADGELGMDWGMLESIKFGLRWNQHKRELNFPNNGGCGWADGGCGSLPEWHGEQYPGDFGKDLGGGAGFLSHVWHLNPKAVEAFVLANSAKTTPYWPGELAVDEAVTAGYAMANLEGNQWRANVGLRLVGTRQTVDFNQPDGADPVDSEFGPFTHVKETKNYFDALPSMNIRFTPTKDIVLRAAASRTIARADYSALAGAITSYDDLTHSGTGGNSDLKPVRSNNYDATVEWYYAPKSLLSFGVFYMQMPSYVSFGTSRHLLLNRTSKQLEWYDITSPINVSARNRGFELSWQQPLYGGFGALANYTYADGKEGNGSKLMGSSKNTYNLEAYYENDSFSARVAYTWRSDFLVGLDRSTNEYMAAEANLAASLNYKINDRFTVTFDALNLNNPVLKYYADNKDQPRAFYSNGRQFYLGVRMSL